MIYKNLIGKEWVMNKEDCFSLTRNFFNQNFDFMNIPDFARPVDWDSDKLDLVRILSKKAGFEMLTVDSWADLRPADVLATCLRSAKPNHLVIILEGNKILHHLAYQRSSVETMRPQWKMLTGYILRHPDIPDLRPTYPDVTIEELLRANHKL